MSIFRLFLGIIITAQTHRRIEHEGNILSPTHDMYGHRLAARLGKLMARRSMPFAWCYQRNYGHDGHFSCKASPMSVSWAILELSAIWNMAIFGRADSFIIIEIITDFTIRILTAKKWDIISRKAWAMSLAHIESEPISRSIIAAKWFYWPAVDEEDIFIAAR